MPPSRLLKTDFLGALSPAEFEERREARIRSTILRDQTVIRLSLLGAASGSGTTTTTSTSGGGSLPGTGPAGGGGGSGRSFTDLL